MRQIKVMLLGLLLLGLVSCKSYPTGMSILVATHFTWPVYVYDTYLNDGNFNGPPRALAAGWEWPKGHSTYLVSYVPSSFFSENDDKITVTASWTELFSNKGWRAKLEFPLSKVPRQDNGEHIRLVIGYGVHGEFVVHAMKDDPSSKAGLDIEMAFVCGERAPELDHDFRPDIGRKLHAFYYDNESDFIPSSRCSESNE